MSGPTARVLELLSLLQSRRVWRGAELARRLEVTERTLRRDVERLRDLGYPVEAAPGISGGYRLAAGAHLPPLVLDDDEAVAIAVGLRVAAGGIGVEGFEDTSLRALAKLEQLLPDRLRRRVGSVHSTVSVLRRPDDRAAVAPRALALLAQACRDHEEVGFDYRRRDGEDSRRRVRPHGLASLDRRWYLVGWDVRRDDWRTFRVDRLRSPTLLGARFEPRPLPAVDVAHFVADSLSRRPMSFTATVDVTGSRPAVERAARWLGADVEPSEVSVGEPSDVEPSDVEPSESDTATAPADGAETIRLRLHADSAPWLATLAAMLAVQFDVVVDGPPSVLDELATLRRRLGRCC